MGEKGGAEEVSLAINGIGGQILTPYNTVLDDLHS